MKERHRNPCDFQIEIIIADLNRNSRSCMNFQPTYHLFFPINWSSQEAHPAHAVENSLFGIDSSIVDHGDPDSRVQVAPYVRSLCVGFLEQQMSKCLFLLLDIECVTSNSTLR